MVLLESLYLLYGFESDVLNHENLKKNSNLPSNRTHTGSDKEFLHLHPSEIAILRSDIVTCSDNFKLCLHLIDRLSEDQYGFYLNALALGVQDYIATPFRSTIIDIEKDLINQSQHAPRLSLSYINQKLSHYKQLFPVFINNIVNEFPPDVSSVELKKSSRLWGVKVLDLLRSNVDRGSPKYCHVILKLYQRCCSVFYQQIKLWTCYARLDDPYDELFFHLKTSSHDRMNQCAMDRDRLPSDVSLQCANNIIFIGKAMQTFYQSKHAKNPTFKDQLQTEKHAKALVELSHSKVKHDQMQFEYIIGNMKNVVSKALMNIVGEDCSLLADLQALRDYFLLGKGNFWMCVIEECERIRLRSTALTPYDLTRLLSKAARRCGCEEDSHLERFSLDANDGVSQSKSNKYGRMLLGTPIQFRYSLQWPLNWLITDSDLQKYNSLCLFLSALKRCQIRLQQTVHKTRLCRNKPFAVLNSKNRDTTASTVDPPTLHYFDREAWHLRNIMMFWLEQLLSYFMTDVIQDQYSIMIHRIQELDNFEDVQKVHQKFVNVVVELCFIKVAPLTECIMSMMNCCEAFCAIVGTDQSDQFDSIRQRYLDGQFFLFRTLDAICNSKSRSDSNRIVNRLILRLDFNKFFTVDVGERLEQQLNAVK